MKYILRCFFSMIMVVTALGANANNDLLGSYTLEVGETKTLYISDAMQRVLSHASTHWVSTTWTCTHQGVLGIISQGKTSCTIKAHTPFSGNVKVEYDVYESDAYGNYTHTKDYYYISVVGGKITISASPNGGTVEKGSKVMLSTNPVGANIYYTLDGTTPNASSNVYPFTGITINNDCTLKAIAMKSDYTNSDVLTTKYTVGLSSGDTFTAKTTEGIDMKFTVNYDKSTCRVEEYAIDALTSGPVTIPAVANGYQVTGIYNNAFKGCSKITSVIMPNSIISMGWHAFSDCSSLSNIALSKSLKYIPLGAFEYCHSLASIDIPSSVTSIQDNAFDGCTNLTNVTVPNSVTSVGSLAFASCKSLESVSLSNSITSIDTSTFLQCISLEEINIPSSVISIGNSAFHGCTQLKKINLSSSLKRIGEYAFNGCFLIEELSGYNNLEYIGSGALHTSTPWAQNLPDGMNFLGKVLFKYQGEMPANTTVSIPAGCTQVYGNAFADKEGLVGINIPAGVVDIAEGAFRNCPNLQTITVDASNYVYDSRNNCNAIIEKATNTLLHGCSNTTIPTNVTSIGSYAFYGNWTKDEIVIPNQIDSIASYAFRNCSNVKSILIGKGLRKMGSYAFVQFPHLKEIAVSTGNPYFDSRDNCNAIIEKATNTLVVGCSTTTIPNTVKTIGSYAFYGNGDEDFTSLVIPNSVEEIKSYAFDSLPYLREVSIGTNVKTFGNYMFYKCNNLEAIESLNGFPEDIDEKVFNSGSEDFSIYDNVTLYVPAGCRNNYRLATGWSNFKNIVEGSLLVGVDDVLTTQPKEEVIYSPTGVRLSAPQRGVNIVNGRKLLVK